MATLTDSRPTGSPVQSARPSPGEITTKGRGLPSRVLLHGVEGVGKTSWAASAPGAVVIQTLGETGLETLIDSGQLGEVPHWAETTKWSDLLAQVDWLTTEAHEHRTLVIDTMNGAERLCHEEVCRRDYKGDWGKSGFASYMQGYEVALADWSLFLQKLDRLRETRKMAIVGLCHTKVLPFRNPEGADYDRYSPAMHAKTWERTSRWADIVLFANYYTVVETVGDKVSGKARGGTSRVMWTERTAAYDAKNRHGLPPMIQMGTTGNEAWDNFRNALKRKDS